MLVLNCIFMALARSKAGARDGSPAAPAAATVALQLQQSATRQTGLGFRQIQEQALPLWLATSCPMWGAQWGP